MAKNHSSKGFQYLKLRIGEDFAANYEAKPLVDYGELQQNVLELFDEVLQLMNSEDQPIKTQELVEILELLPKMLMKVLVMIKSREIL